MSTDDSYVYGASHPNTGRVDWWSAVSAVICRDHNPEDCLLCGPARGIVATESGRQTGRTFQVTDEGEIQQWWPITLPSGREVPTPFFGTAAAAETARAALGKREAELRAELARKVSLAAQSVIDQHFIAHGYGTMGESGQLAIRVAEVAVDVLTDTVREGKI